MHSEIVSGARYAGGVRPGRGAAPEAPRRPRRICSSTSTSGAGEAREIARARVARRTWTLDALRAATEPVKVEAMQAILMFWWGVWCGAFAGMALRSREAVVYRRVATRFCQLGRFFARFDFFRTAKQSRFRDENASRETCQLGRQNRVSPRKTVSRDFQVRAESIRVARNPSFWVDFRECRVFFSLSNARFRETGDR